MCVRESALAFITVLVGVWAGRGRVEEGRRERVWRDMSREGSCEEGE